MNIIELAKEAGISSFWAENSTQQLERFAALVAAHEREVLAEQDKQEPVAWMWQSVDIESRSIETGLLFNRGADDENTDWTPLYAAPVFTPEQEPIGYVVEDYQSYTGSMIYANKSCDEMLPVYIAPVSAEAIRAEALEEAAKWFEDEEHPLQPKEVAAAIRGLK